VACGSSGPDGVSACSLAEYEEAQRPRWRVGASGVYTSTVMSFSSTLHLGETREAVLADVAYAPTSRLGLSLALGATVGGKLLAPDGPHDFNPGIATALGVSYRIASGATPIGHAFLVTSGLVSFSSATTELNGQGARTPYDALDFRVGVSAGLTWLRALSVYAVARAFGGPAYWSYQGASELGTDTHHYQVGGGLAVLILRRVELFAEGVPLGEQAVAAGAAVAF
jgi:hypothetical protein